MTDLELQQLRREKWRLDGKPIRTIEQARAFLEDVGFCLMYPQASGAAGADVYRRVCGIGRSPAGMAACIQRSASGRGDRIDGAVAARARGVRSESVRREQRISGRRRRCFLISMRWWASAIPSWRRRRDRALAYSALACDAFELISRDGPISKQKIAGSAGRKRVAAGARWRAGRVVVEAAHHARRLQGERRVGLGRALPLGAGRGEGGRGLSVQEALTALLSKYLDCVIAVEQADLEVFFGNFVARSKVKDAVNALLAARELSFVHVSGQSMLQITPEKSCGHAGCAACGAESVLFRTNTATGAEAPCQFPLFAALKRRLPLSARVRTPDISTSFVPDHQNYARYTDPKTYRGRLAPSPTGLLHLGHARTFWICGARAAEQGGDLIFRNEDLDSQRCRAEFVQAMFEDLRWLGIEWSRRAGLRRSVWSLRAERAAGVLPFGVEDTARTRTHLSVHLLAEGCGAGGGGAE